MSNFKKGDRVYHFQYGWGTVKKVDGIMSVIFTHGIVTFIEGRLLSFTEYTLQGFSQERPVELPEVGELCLVRDLDSHDWIAREFVNYKPENEFQYITRGDVCYSQMKRIKILD
jgi:hypothetical protein